MMNVKVRIQKVFDDITKETKQELVVVNGKKTFIGALFFKKEEWNKPKKIVEELVVEGSALDVMLAAYNLIITLVLKCRRVSILVGKLVRLMKGSCKRLFQNLGQRMERLFQTGCGNQRPQWSMNCISN